MAVSDDQTILDALGAAARRARGRPRRGARVRGGAGPEHLQLAGTGGRSAGAAIQRAGCLFVGSASGTAFGDYVAGSNHVLPTEGAARFASAQRAPLPAADGGGPAAPRARPWPPPACRSPRPRRSRPTPPRWAASENSSPVSTRTASISRKTGETDVTLSLGAGRARRGTRSTGVGFFDHMLDLLARHGRLELDVQVVGDLETGSHHTVEDTGIVLGQALDQALGDRPGSTATGTRSCRWTRRARVLDRHLRPALHARLRLRAAAERHDQRLRLRRGRGVLPRRGERRAADRSTSTCRPARTPTHGRGAASRRSRALRVAVAIDPDEPGVPSTKGTLTSLIALADYGMGNRRSVEKALAHVGAESFITSDRARRGRDHPARGRRVPEAMRNLERSGLREQLVERAAAGVPLLGICLGMQLLFESSVEHEGAEGLGILPGTVTTPPSRRGSRTSAGTSSRSRARPP